MSREPEDDRQQHSGLIVYDAEEDLSRKCCICFEERPILISPCQCNILYHQRCLLSYIKERLQAMQSELDLTLLRCHQCRQQLRFFYIENSHWGCVKGRGWCNKVLLIVITLFTAIIILAVLLARQDPSQQSYWALLALQCVLCLLLLVSAAHWTQRSFTYKQIILVRVYEYTEVMRNNSNSSSDSPHYQIYSQMFEIIINEHYYF